MKIGVGLASRRVRDVMTQPVVFVDARHTLEEAWQILHTHGISGAPVLGNAGKIVGIVTRSDLADPRRHSSFSTTVESVATKVVYAVRANDPVMNAVRLMIDQNIHRTLVVNDDGTLAGIVAPMDVLKALVRGEDISDSSSVEYVNLGKIREQGRGDS